MVVGVCLVEQKLDMMPAFACAEGIGRTTKHPLDRIILSCSPTQPNQSDSRLAALYYQLVVFPRDIFSVSESVS